MKINVPLIRQPKNSAYCGLAGISMILKYYGIDESIEKIKKDMNIYKVGTFVPQQGSYFLKKGFEVEIITLHPGLFTLKDRNMSSKRIPQRLKSIYRKSKKRDKIVLNYFMEFLQNGGGITVKIPDINDIKEEINKKRPLLVLVTSNFLLGSKPRFNFHANVVTGLDKKYIYANDPSWDERGGRNKYLINDFFYGLYASAYGDYDNSTLMKIRKNN